MFLDGIFTDDVFMGSNFLDVFIGEITIVPQNRTSNLDGMPTLNIENKHYQLHTGVIIRKSFSGTKSHNSTSTHEHTHFRCCCSMLIVDVVLFRIWLSLLMLYFDSRCVCSILVFDAVRRVSVSSFFLFSILRRVGVTKKYSPHIPHDFHMVADSKQQS